MTKIKMNNHKHRKIGVFNYSLNGGGAERVVASLISLWESCGYFVVLFTEVQINNNSEFAVSNTTECVVLPKEYKSRMLAWKAAVDKYDLEVLVHHNYPHKCIKDDTEFLLENGVKTIVVVHDPLCAERYGFDPWNNTLYNGLQHINVDALVCLSPVETLWWGLLLKRPAFYIPNPITFPILNVKKNAKNTGKSILWIGRFTERKRLDHAIKAFSIILHTHKDAELIILGDGGNKLIDSKYRKLARELNISAKVKFIGKQRDVSVYFSQADVHLITSASESFGLTIAESKMHGIPVVMYELPNLSLTKGNTGIVTAEWGNINDLADKLLKVLGDKEYCKKLSEEGNLSIGEFSDDKILDYWNDIFSEIIDGIKTDRQENKYQTIENYNAIVFEMMRSWNFFMKKNYWKLKIFEKIEQYINLELVKKIIRKRWPHVF